ncbi:MAG: hypothetical protein BWY57_03206 [Betaproteobacteria bacterium ADurb.Bin341]|nr:MAG: hypothetical protein BWY57_03206 [Betaproteobacteria bacterium ADurb.Bin341]
MQRQTPRRLIRVNERVIQQKKDAGFALIRQHALHRFVREKPALKLFGRGDRHNPQRRPVDRVVRRKRLVAETAKGV